MVGALGLRRSDERCAGRRPWRRPRRWPSVRRQPRRRRRHSARGRPGLRLADPLHVVARDVGQRERRWRVARFRSRPARGRRPSAPISVATNSTSTRSRSATAAAATAISRLAMPVCRNQRRLCVLEMRSAVTVTPALSSAWRTVRAVSTAFGASPCKQSVGASISRSSPSVVSMRRSSTTRTALRATRSGSQACLTGSITRAPPGSYSRSGNASAANRTPWASTRGCQPSGQQQEREARVDTGDRSRMLAAGGAERV